MNDLVLAALIAATPGTLGVVVSLINLRNGKRRDVKMNVQSEQLEALHASTNGLSKRNEDIAKALGRLEGKADEKANPTL